jgi:capsular polysaccharide export protein
VLVVDQTFGDASIKYGLCGSESFKRMLDAAHAENPQAMILVKVHPDVFAGRKKGYLDHAALANLPRVQVLGEDVHPVNLIARAEAVYTVTSQVGFEGLLWGKPVRTFGMPFYAGWGLTHDDIATPLRRTKVQLPDLIHAALIEYPRYADPETGMRCEPERLIEWMGFQRRMLQRFPQTLHAVGISLAKRSVVRAFFHGSSIEFVRRPGDAPEDATLVVWGRGDTKEKRPVVRLEDGFLRSVGLGAELVRPLSLVQDRLGLYYDSTTHSDLEHILQTAEFSADLIRRAEHLRNRLIEAEVTKYNVGEGAWQRPVSASRVILVPGQVELDASIRYGTAHIATNMKLLHTVREMYPSAYVVYKPHPDVAARLRRRGEKENAARLWCDEIVTDVPMAKLLDAVDEIHVMTSLTGFEALLRSKPVTCHGMPFYAGWGLTLDRSPIARRSRRLTINELIAATLILYPTYVSRMTGKFTTAENALDELITWKKEERTTLYKSLKHLCLRLWKYF